MFRADAAALALCLLASPVLAQTRASDPSQLTLPAVGAPVRDVDGEALGRIESVTRDPEGRPVQVVVRTRGMAGVGAQSRAVPIASLRPQGSGWRVPLRRAEFNLLPPVRP